MKDLIVVFSYSHGNTIRIAKMIQKQLGNELVDIRDSKENWG